MASKKEDKEPEEKEEIIDTDELSTDQKIDLLSKEIKELRAEQKQKEQETTVKEQRENFKRELLAQANKFDITKDNESMASSVAAEVIARAQNSRYDLQTLYKKVVTERMEQIKKFMEIEKDKHRSNSKVSAFLDNTVRSSGGVPQIDTEKKLTPADVKSGKSREMMTQVLNELYGG